MVALSPGPSEILSRSCEIKSGRGLGTRLVSWNIYIYIYDRRFILKLLIHHLNLEFSIFSDIVEPQIKEQLEAAKDAEIGEVVSAQLSSVCAVWKNNFRNYLLSFV